MPLPEIIMRLTQTLSPCRDYTIDIRLRQNTVNVCYFIEKRCIRCVAITGDCIDASTLELRRECVLGWDSIFPFLETNDENRLFRRANPFGICAGMD